MKLQLILGVMLLSSFTLVAQTEDKDLNPKDPKAQKVLDALSQKAKEFKSFKADFEYTLESPDANETAKGSVLMKGQKKYKVNIAGREITCNGETVWTFVEDDNFSEVTIADLPEEDDEDGNMMNPANAFHMYKNGFKYRHDGTSTVDGTGVEIISMFPIDPGKKNYHTVILYIDTEKMELLKTVVKGKDGNEYTYRLKNFTPNVAVTDADFEFDESRADDVIDLRD